MRLILNVRSRRVSTLAGQERSVAARALAPVSKDEPATPQRRCEQSPRWRLAWFEILPPDSIGRSPTRQYVVESVSASGLAEVRSHVRRESSIVMVSVTRQSALTAAGAVLVFGCVFAVGYYATRASLPDPWRARYYVDALVLRYYFGSVVLMGAVPVLFGLTRLGLIYVAGASAGWIANCIMIATMDPLRPTMQPAVYSFFIVVVGALVALAVEVVHQARSRRKRQTKASASSSS